MTNHMTIIPLYFPQVAENCIINDKGVVKICGFHCARLVGIEHEMTHVVIGNLNFSMLCFVRSSWCCKPIDNHLYSNKVPLIAPEISDDSSEPTSKTDVWVFGESGFGRMYNHRLNVFRMLKFGVYFSLRFIDLNLTISGLLVYTIITAGQKPINTVEQVNKCHI